MTPRWSMHCAMGFLALATAVWIQWLSPEPWGRADAAVRDAYLRFQVDRQPEDRLVVIDIDEYSLHEVGAWPWSRALLADLAEFVLVDGGARALALDMVLPEVADAVGDKRLAALAEHASITLAHVMDFIVRDDPIQIGVLATHATQPGTQGALTATGYIANHGGLARARCVGNIGYQPDSDGVLRHFPAKSSFDKLSYLPLAAALLRCAHPDTLLPLPNSKGQWRIPYLHSIEAYKLVPAIQVLRREVDQNVFRGRYVLVGSSAMGFNDRVATPLQALAPGIFVHAQGLSGLLDIEQGRAHAPWDGTLLTLGWSAISIAAAVLAIGSLHAWRSTLVLMTLAILWLGIAWAGVARQAEFSITAPLTAYFLVLLTSIPFEWRQSQRQTRRLLDTFSQYVAKPVIDQIQLIGLKQSLTPTKLDITVLIADMEGYTRATSELSLPDAARLTKEFLSCITSSVLAEGGTLDKYTGDGLVAFWGAPVPSPDHADRAVKAGLSILAAVDRWNGERLANGQTALRVRIGIESGPALVGDLGTAFRSNYTAVGDCINFAARLEAAARDLPSDLVLGPQTQARLVNYRARSLGLLRLRGISSEIEIFAPDLTHARYMRRR